MGQILRDLGRNERGATLVEYGIIVALVALTAVSALRAVGDGVYSHFGQTADAQAMATGAGGGGHVAVPTSGTPPATFPGAGGGAP